MADGKVWKPLDLVKVTAEYLAGKSVPSPRLDAEILLCEVMGLKRRVDLYAGFESEVSGKALAAYREAVKRRAAREPVSRILGRREFMGIDFRVTPDVLSPRPETELLVEAALEAVNPKRREPEAARAEEDPREGAEAMPAELERLLDSYAEDVDSLDDDSPPAVPVRGAAEPVRRPASSPPGKAARNVPSRAVRALDLGSGSGCIAVSLAAHLPGARVVAVDASPKALAVARKNAAAANVADRIDFRQGDWFAGCRRGEAFDLILSNPPYLMEGDAGIWPEVRAYDPPLALYGGQDGLDCYRRIVPAAADWLAPGGRIFLEVGAGQAERVAAMLERRGFAGVGVVKDYGGVGRVVKAASPE